MMRTLGGVVFAAATIAASAVSAQVGMVRLPNGGLVPCDHPLAYQAGMGCGAVSSAPAPPSEADYWMCVSPAARAERFVLGAAYATRDYSYRVRVAGALMDAWARPYYVIETIEAPRPGELGLVRRTEIATPPCSTGLRRLQ